MADSTEDLPLTQKFDRYIRKLSFNFNVPYEDALQEARLLEWKIQRKQLIDIDSYFMRVIRNKLKGYYNDYWGTNRLPSESGEPIINALMTMRGFNQIHYDSLVNHLSILIAEIDIIALEVFQLRINEGIKWNEIRKKYPEVTHRRFFGVVGGIQRLTKRVIEEELSVC